MEIQDLVRSLKTTNDSKIVMLVADGLGACPWSPGARPNWKRPAHAQSRRPGQARRAGAAFRSSPASRPAAGRGTWACSATIRSSTSSAAGLLEATGIGFELGPNDVAHPRQFCTLDAAGKITDRRAGRIGTRGERPVGRPTAAGEESRAWKCSSNRSRSIASWSSSAAPAWAATCTTPIRRRRACRRWTPMAHEPGSQRTAEVAAEFVAQAPADPGRREEGQRSDAARLFGRRICPATKKSTG